MYVGGGGGAWKGGGGGGVTVNSIITISITVLVMGGMTSWLL